MSILSPAAAGLPAPVSARRRLHPLHVHISVLFTLLILISGGILGWHNYRQTSEVMLSAADDLFERIGRETVLEIARIYAPIELLTDFVAKQQITRDTTLDARLQRLPALVEALAQSPAISAFYIGYDNGDFFLVRPLGEDAAQRKNLDAPANAAFLVQSVQRGADAASRGRFVYLDRSLRTLSAADRPDYTFDPGQRDWYKRARAADSQIKTAPYVFFTTREPGITFARKAPGAVVGADVTLTQVSDLLSRQKITPSSELVLFDAEGQVIGYNRKERPLWKQNGGSSLQLARLEDLAGPAREGLPAALAAGKVGDNFNFRAGGMEWIGRINKLDARGQAVYLGMLAPQDELLVDAARIRTEGIAITLAILLITIPVTWLLSRAISRSLRELSAGAKAIQRFNFEPTAAADSFVLEIHELAQTMAAMRSTIRKFLDISSALAAEKDLDRLLERVLSESIVLSGADAGIIYLIEDDGVTLVPAHYIWPAASQRESLPELAPLRLNGAATHLVTAAARDNRTQVVVLRRGAADDDARYFGRAFELFGTDRIGLAAIPLRNRQQEAIGVLAVKRNAGRDSSAAPFPAEQISFMQALSGNAAVSIEARQLMKAQKLLLESLIELVASAIDAKSPYTGGHCQRVPELTKMLARAACDAQSGPFRDFNLSEEQWEAVHIASWLHDCGKVTTPEYVVDKATKLETIYDRIHEVRMRFEVLKRDAEIEYLKAVAAGGDQGELASRLAALKAELDAEFAFVGECNVGGEFMAPEKIERLQRIARRTWTRTLDDRIGVSHEESKRKERVAAPALPVQEALLADKQEHVFERGESDRVPQDNPWGFRIDAPEHKLNKGELHNLSIGRGTLTREERFIINDHIVQTIIMLTRLPFPRHLKSVPEIAGGHHEKMDGTGYPKRLNREQMSPVARMMAIADIFEALTAADRPYKKGKTLSESIRIMSFMKKDRHIDPELFDLFLSSGVYLRYAERYMQPELIDEVDIRQYLSAAA